jgi:hypothetical protein
MRVGKIGRWVVRAIIVGLLTAGAWAAATMTAQAENHWEIGPMNGPALEEPAVQSR